MTIVFKYIQQAMMGFDNAADISFEPYLNEHPPIFILGSPRSGSTLLQQSLINEFQIGYMSNLMALFPRHMLRLGKYSRRFMRNHISEHRSSYGYIPGLFSPNEGGAIFRHYFEEDYDRIKVRAIFATLTAQMGTPFVFKNLFNVLRIKEILDAMPEARFIWLKRDPIFAAQSIYLARIKNLGDVTCWWSVAPPGFEEMLDKDVFSQVAWQVAEINRIIGRVFDARQSADDVVVSYEELCLSPREQLAIIGRKLMLKGVSENYPLLESMRYENNIKVDKNCWTLLNEACEKFCS